MGAVPRWLLHRGCRLRIPEPLPAPTFRVSRCLPTTRCISVSRPTISSATSYIPDSESMVLGGAVRMGKAWALRAVSSYRTSHGKTGVSPSRLMMRSPALAPPHWRRRSALCGAESRTVRRPRELHRETGFACRVADVAGCSRMDRPAMVSAPKSGLPFDRPDRRTPQSGFASPAGNTSSSLPKNPSVHSRVRMVTSPRIAIITRSPVNSSTTLRSFAADDFVVPPDGGPRPAHHTRDPRVNTRVSEEPVASADRSGNASFA